MPYRRNRGLASRILIAALFVPVFLVLLFLGGLPFLVFVCAITVVGAYELQRSWRAEAPAGRPIFLLAAVLPAAAYLGGERALTTTLAVVILISFIAELLTLQLHQRAVRLFAGIGGLVYVGFLLSFLILIRQLAGQGLGLAISLLLATWMGDTGAYAIGSLWGRHRLLSTYSARKSWEGGGGALLFSLAAMSASGLWLDVGLAHLLILGTVVGGMGQLGDLFASALKRSLAIKDFGGFLLGHGGLLDRFDSLLFTAPIYFLYVKYIIS